METVLVRKIDLFPPFSFTAFSCFKFEFLKLILSVSAFGNCFEFEQVFKLNLIIQMNYKEYVSIDIDINVLDDCYVQEMSKEVMFPALTESTAL